MNRLGAFSLLSAALALSMSAYAGEKQGATDLGAPTPQQKLKCVNIKNTRWQLCGEASRTKLVAGVGIRFAKILPNGQLAYVGGSHSDCGAASNERAVPAEIRQAAAAECSAHFERR